MGNKKIALYGLSTCPSCKKTAKLLEKMGVEFERTEVDLLPSGEQWLTTKEVKKFNPAATYPTLVVSTVIVGFDEDTIREAVGNDP